MLEQCHNMILKQFQHISCKNNFLPVKKSSDIIYLFIYLFIYFILLIYLPFFQN